MKHLKILLKNLTAAFSLLMLFSCASSPEKKIDSIYVMVYDYDSGEIMDVSVFMDGKEIGKTDIYGRFMYPCNAEKKAVIRVEKTGYESVETNACIKPGIVLYFKMGSSLYYAQKAEKLLDENSVQEALKMIDTALKIQERTDWHFLRKVILRRCENAE